MILEEVTTITPEQLAKRWNIDTTTVYKYVNTGVLKRVGKIGAVRILLSHVYELEENVDARNKTYKERKLERILQDKEQEIEILLSALSKIQSVSIDTLYTVSHNYKGDRK